MLEAERRRIEKEIEELTERREKLLKEVSDLRSMRERVAEEVHALKVVRDSVSKMLSEEMELLGRAEMNNLVAGNMYKAGVDALANAIVNDPRFLAMFATSALNEYLAKQTEIFTKIVNENAKRVKQEVTNLSIMAELLQRQAKL